LGGAKCWLDLGFRFEGFNGSGHCGRWSALTISVLAPGALLTVGGGNDRRFAVRLSGMSIDRSCSLGAEVARLGVEFEGADAVGAVRAGKLHAALDALDSIGFHYLNCRSSASGSKQALVRRRR